MVTTKSRHHATTPPARGGSPGRATRSFGGGGEGGGRHGPGGPLPAMGTGGRGALEAWAETEREREPFTEEESDTEEEEVGSVASGAGGGAGGGIGVGGTPLSVSVKKRRGSIFTQAYDEGLKALLTPQARKLRSKLNLVDLAGSERAKASGADEDTALMRELVNINRSLSALGNVIAALSEAKGGHIPYRDSKLTQLLEESLGGNSHTVMVNTVSVKAINATESLSTLQWAKRAQAIVNVSVQGVDSADVQAAMARMREAARFQRQAAEQAKQAARDRAIGLQAELDAARSSLAEVAAAAEAQASEAVRERDALRRRLTEEAARERQVMAAKLQQAAAATATAAAEAAPAAQEAAAAAAAAVAAEAAAAAAKQEAKESAERHAGQLLQSQQQACYLVINPPRATRLSIIHHPPPHPAIYPPYSPRLSTPPPLPTPGYLSAQPTHRYPPPQAKRMQEAEAEARAEMSSLQKTLRRSELAREESEAKEAMLAAREKQQLDAARYEQLGGFAARLATAEDDAKKLRAELDAARLELNGARYELEVARSDDDEHAAREAAAAAELAETKRAAEEELEKYRAREVLVERQLAEEKQAREADREQWRSESLELARQGDETVRWHGSKVVSW